MGTKKKSKMHSGSLPDRKEGLMSQGSECTSLSELLLTHGDTVQPGHTPSMISRLRAI